jgi:hypothetical protein
MLKQWYARKQLDRLATATGMQLASWSALRRLAGLKQLIVPTAHLFYEGEPRIRQFFAVEDQTLSTKQRVLQVAASLARSSSKPIFKLLVQAAEEEGLTLREMESDGVGEAGAVGKLDRTWFVLGDATCMTAENIELGVTIQTLAQQFELDGKYTLFLAQKQPKRLLGIFACEYELQGGATEAVQALRGVGVELVLLTGAKTSIAKGLGTRLSLSLIHSELTGTEKDRVLASLMAQQPASLMLSAKSEGKKVDRILLGKKKTGTEKMAMMPDLATLAAVITEARLIVAEARHSLFWRNL